MAKVQDLFARLEDAIPSPAPRRGAQSRAPAAQARNPEEAYTAADIEVLEGLEPVRRRPGMYIGGTDDKALHHLFAEVIDNAMDEAVAGHATWIDVTLEEDGFLTVTDNGRGIPPEDMPVLFDKFHRGRPAPHSAAVAGATTAAEFLEDADVSGVGLGLYLGRNVMEQMGGRISVESEVGRGSAFTLHLPVWREGGCGRRPRGEDGNGEKVTGG